MICEGLPRERFAHLPTPLERAPRLSQALGVNLLVKREDLTGLCVGGNKTRLLEFALGSLRNDGVDTLIAYAAEQSNKLRDIAAAAARCGMDAILLIPASQKNSAAVPQGNRLLFDVLGASVREIEPGLGSDAILARQEAIRDELAAAGRTAAILDRHLDYGIDATVAYVDAAEELHGQLQALGESPAAVFIAAGAGMTAGGLALGLKHLGAPTRVVGVSSASAASVLLPAIEWQAARAAERLGLLTRLAARDLTIVDDYIGAGYGTLTPRAAETIRLFARLHGMVVDPVYNANVVLAIRDHAASGKIPRGATVVYVNTGGGPAIFNYSAELAGGLPAGSVMTGAAVRKSA
ncbi:MAG TPA: pyridoxal-phosphate dependent enzyme [Rhizobiaceae bacterium]|nr:pyridoxal-phosphate dependent enzyme [Rhizobiaceae bacterium]